MWVLIEEIIRSLFGFWKLTTKSFDAFASFGEFEPLGKNIVRDFQRRLVGLDRALGHEGHRLSRLSLLSP